MKIEVMKLIGVTCIVAAALVGCGSDSDDETPPDTVEVDEVDSEVDEEKQEVEEEKQEVKDEVDEEVNG
jgi:hypothetical protein